MDVSEKLRLKLLEEEQRLRGKQPKSWTSIKYRKSVKLPKDLIRKAKKVKKFQGKKLDHSKIKLKRKSFKGGKKKRTLV